MRSPPPASTGCGAEERALVQQACVLGKSFSIQALAALTGRPKPELEPLLAGLVRKEVLSLQADPRPPERGQYGFLQELLRQVAYDTLSRRDRKARHLAAVAALEQTFEEADQEVPEVIAAHLLAAADAVAEDADTPRDPARARGRRSSRPVSGRPRSPPPRRRGSISTRRPRSPTASLPAGRAALEGGHARLPGGQHSRGAAPAGAGDPPLRAAW